MRRFYKVVVIDIDIFESIITDERHFANAVDAKAFAEDAEARGYAVVLAEFDRIEIC